MKVVLKTQDISYYVTALLHRLIEDQGCGPQVFYGVPRGGVPVADLCSTYSNGRVTSDPDDATIIVDDIVDSGTTRDRYAKSHPTIPFYALIEKKPQDNNWYVFPWEIERGEETGVEDNIVRLLQFIGEDSTREGLQETPKRVARAWQHWCRGYWEDVPALLKTFKDGAEDCDELVIVKDIPFYSHCEHHLAPFFGTATIGYIPDGKVVGLSKLSRVLDAFSARLQVQERLTNQIADALIEHLQPLGVGVRLQARHLCMESRGVCKQGHSTITSAVRGVLRTDATARAEWLQLL